jgi:hypothetical protein
LEDIPCADIDRNREPESKLVEPGAGFGALKGGGSLALRWWCSRLAWLAHQAWFSRMSGLAFIYMAFAMGNNNLGNNDTMPSSKIARTVCAGRRAGSFHTDPEFR